MRGYFAKNRRGEGKVNRKKNLRAGHFLTCGLQKRGKIGIFVKYFGSCRKQRLKVIAHSGGAV